MADYIEQGQYTNIRARAEWPLHDAIREAKRRLQRQGVETDQENVILDALRAVLLEGETAEAARRRLGLPSGSSG